MKSGDLDPRIPLEAHLAIVRDTSKSMKCYSCETDLFPSSPAIATADVAAGQLLRNVNAGRRFESEQERHTQTHLQEQLDVDMSEAEVE